MKRFCSIFSQLLKLFPRSEFDQLVRQTHAERRARGFACWDQFVAMLFCQLGRAQSLREICGGLLSCEGKLVHLGVSAPSRSTLAYVNARRPWQLCEAPFHRLLARWRGKIRLADATRVTWLRKRPRPLEGPKKLERIPSAGYYDAI